MFIGVVIIQDRKALNAFYVLMSQDGGRDPAILSARQYFGNFYRMAVELFRSLLFLCLQSALSSTIFRDLFFQCWCLLFMHKQTDLGCPMFWEDEKKIINIFDFDY